MHQAPRTVLVVALVLGLALLAPGGAPPAAAQGCPPPGGVDLGWAQPAPGLDFHVLGRGWGHGVGMSQHGAEGAARLGCNAGQILGTYYPGTQITQRDDRSIRVGITFPGGHRDAIRVETLAENEPVVWQFGNVEARTQPAGEIWRARVDGAGRLSLQSHDGDDWVDEWEAPGPAGRLTVALGGGRHVRVRDKATDRYREGITYNRGTLLVEPRIVGGSLTGFLRAVVALPSIEQYLYGLDEMPSGWQPAALQAQAIAGRSYAHRRTTIDEACGCHLVDSPAAQVYNAYDQEQRASWRQAVDATARQVLTHDGQIAETFYSSSHGGQSERLGFSAFFSGSEQRAYLRPVDDSRWEAASMPNRVTRWGASYSREHMTAAMAHLGVGTVLSVQTPLARGAGHRIGVPGRTNADGQSYGGVVVVGSAGTARISGKDFIDALQASESPPRLAYRSELFQVVTGRQCQPSSDQSGNEVVRRSSGEHRVATAAAVSAQHWDAADDVLLATSITFPDALSAGALAARLDAPILLTRGSRLDPEARAEIERLRPERVHLMGGSAALSTQVAQQVGALGVEVVRVQGPGRFDTAAEAALAAGPSETGEVALASGNDWPDAVSAGALSGGPDRIPTLLSQRDAVPGVTLDALRELDAERVLLVGGTAVLSASVAQQLAAEGYEVARLSGPSRFATSVAVARDAAGRAGGDRPVVLATGAAFPDALSAGGLVARIGAGLVLTTQCDLASIPDTIEHLEDGPYDRGVIVGGTAAVSDLVREQATGAIAGGQ